MQTRRWAPLSAAIAAVASALLLSGAVDVHGIQLASSAPFAPPTPASKLKVKFDSNSYVIDTADKIHVSLVEFKPLKNFVITEEFLKHASLAWWWYDEPESGHFATSGLTCFCMIGWKNEPVPLPHDFVFSFKDALKNPNDGIVHPGHYDIYLTVSTPNEFISSESVPIRVFQTEAEREQALKDAQAE